MPLLLSRPTKRHLLISLSVLLILLYLFQYGLDGPTRLFHPSAAPGCPHQPAGAHDIVLVMKTSSSEIESKFQIHFNTTFKCIPHVLIFSDKEEDYQGHHIYNAVDMFQKVGVTTYNNNKRDGAQLADKLDRFKSIPMLRKAYELKPKAHWFVFIDTEIFISWNNVVSWLNRLDHTQSSYFGFPVTLPDGLVYADGYAGFVISQPAAKTVATEVDLKQQLKIAKDGCCGDVAIGRVLAEKGVALTSANPGFQNESMSSLSFDAKNWCFAVMSLSHMKTEDIGMVYNASLEIQNLQYADIFGKILWPKIKQQNQRTNWVNSPEINLSDLDKPATPGIERDATLSSCRQACLEDFNCLQFSYSYRGRQCVMSSNVRYGHAAPDEDNVTSEWMLERIGGFKSSRCGVEWPVL